MNRPDIFKLVLERYKFDNPLPPEVKRELLKAKRGTLVAILKKHGKYSLLVMFAVVIFFWIKKMGFGLSIAKCVLIAAAVSVASAGVVATGAFIAVKKIVIDKPVEIKEFKEDVEGIDEKKAGWGKVSVSNEKKTINRIPKINYKLAAVPFEFDGDKKISEKIRSEIVNNLVRLKGKNAATFYSRKKQVNHMIYGSISKLGSAYHITVKIVDSKTSNVKLYITEKVKNEDDIESVCKTISKKIAGKPGIL